jgi:hypothetical protein
MSNNKKNIITSILSSETSSESSSQQPCQSLATPANNKIGLFYWPKIEKVTFSS